VVEVGVEALAQQQTSCAPAASGVGRSAVTTS
jgi:hypothetical protein